MPKNGKGREVLQHPTTQEGPTPISEQSADYSHLDQQFTTFSDAYVAALTEANAHRDQLEQV
jgi:hypothetical protein